MRPTTPALAQRSADVIVIGGGATGALTSLELAKRGYSVIALEKASLGNGSSSRSAACIRAQWDKRENVIAMMYCEWYFDHFHELLGVPKNEWVYTKSGYLFLYEDPAIATGEAATAFAKKWGSVQETVAMQQKLGLPVELLDREEVHRRWPHLSPERIIGATWCPTDGFLNHDLVYQLGFESARALGARVVTNAEVIGATHNSGEIATLQTTQGEFSAYWIVNATNAWASRVSVLLGGSPLRIEPLKRYLYNVKPDPKAFPDDSWKRYPMTIYGMGKGRGAYSRPHHNELMFGWAHDASPEPNFTDQDQDVIESRFHHDAGDDGHWFQLRLLVNEFSEQLAAAGRPQTTCGYYGVTPDSSPIIDVDPLVPNLVHVAGCSGHGLMMAPINALTAAAVIVGNGRVVNGQVPLPAAFSQQLSVPTGHFAFERDFSKAESKII